MLELDDITGAIIDAAIRIHKVLGPGLLESVSDVVSDCSLYCRGLRGCRTNPVFVYDDGLIFYLFFCVDLVVDAIVVSVLNSMEVLSTDHGNHLLAYLRLMETPIGLLSNFCE